MNNIGITLWISLEQFKNMMDGKVFYAYSEKTEKHVLQITIPSHAINEFSKSVDKLLGIRFMIYEKNRWQ